MNKLHDRIIRVAECIASELLANTWHETVCGHDGHIDIN
jgi:hypothetical protein